MTDTDKKQLTKQWRDILKEFRDVDYRRALLARDTLAKFGRSAGAMAKFLKDDVGMKEHEIKDAFDRAAALKVISDRDRWYSVGGFKRLKKLVHLPTREAIEVVSEAEKGGFVIETILRRRETDEPPKKQPREKTGTGPRYDAEKLALFLDGCGVRLPPDIRNLVRIYVPVPRRPDPQPPQAFA